MLHVVDKQSEMATCFSFLIDVSEGHRVLNGEDMLRVICRSALCTWLIACVGSCARSTLWRVPFRSAVGIVQAIFGEK